MSVPLSQTSLLALVAANWAMHPLLRFVLSFGGVIAGWLLLGRILPWGIGEAAAPAWAMSMAIQAITVFIATGLLSTLTRIRLEPGMHSLENEVHHPSVRFGIASLMLWTTLVGLAFGFIRVGQYYWKWNASVLGWEFMAAMPIIGITNGMVAAIWLWATRPGSLKRKCLNLFLAFQLTLGISFAQYYLTIWIIGKTVVTIGSSMTLLVGQSFILCLSLVVIRASLASPRHDNRPLQNT